jgi:hypothetical protein
MTPEPPEGRRRQLDEILVHCLRAQVPVPEVERAVHAAYAQIGGGGGPRPPHVPEERQRGPYSALNGSVGGGPASSRAYGPLAGCAIAPSPRAV